MTLNLESLTEGIESGALSPEALLSGMTFPVTLVTVLACMLMAFYSYRIFRIEISVVGSVLLGYVGYALLAPLVLQNVQIENVNLAAAIGIVCAIAGWFIAHALYKLVVFAAGALLGYSLGAMLAETLASTFTDVQFLCSDTGKIVVAAVCALIAGILFISLFKVVYILLTSLGGMISAVFLAGMSVCDVATMPAVYLGLLVLGTVLGIVAAVHQFKHAVE